MSGSSKYSDWLLRLLKSKSQKLRSIAEHHAKFYYLKFFTHIYNSNRRKSLRNISFDVSTLLRRCHLMYYKTCRRWRLESIFVQINRKLYPLNSPYNELMSKNPPTSQLEVTCHDRLHYTNSISPRHGDSKFYFEYQALLQWRFFSLLSLANSIPPIFNLFRHMAGD